MLRHLREVVWPWAARQRSLIRTLQRSYEEVYFVAPAATPEWRVAVAASVGTLWGDYVFALRRHDDATSAAYEPVESRFGYYGTFDEPLESEKRLARYAFEACIALSRRHRLLTRHTLTCEAWLATNYRAEHRRLDELMPTPHTESIGAALQFAPVSLISAEALLARASKARSDRSR